jgi:DNA-binding NarL/FixJ family response regulator
MPDVKDGEGPVETPAEEAGATEGQEPQESARPTSVRDAIGEARARMEKGEPLVPEGEEESSEEEGARAEAEPSEPEATDPEGGLEEEEPEGEEPGPEGEAEAEGEEEEESEAGSDPEAEEELVVARLPGRGPEDPDIEIEVPKELQEDFNRLRNMAMRGAEFRDRITGVEEREARTTADQEELQVIEESLREDPAGFVLERVRPELRVELLRSLLADNEVWENEELQNQIREWERDPNKRELFAERTRRERLERRQTRDQELRLRREMREGAAESARHVKALIPEEWPPERTQKFWNVSMRLLGEAAHRRESSRFTRDEIVQVLDRGGVLDGYGIDPAAASSSAPEEGADRAGAQGKRTGGEERRSRRPAARRRSVTPEEARDTGKRLQDQSKRRKAAAAYAPAGAGAPAAAAELPKGQSVRERIKTVRKLGGLSRVLGGK